MHIRPILPKVLMIAIIVLGGFGLVRMVLIRHDPAGLGAIVASLALAGVCRRLATTHGAQIPKFTEPRETHVQPSAHYSDIFRIYPGRLEGYVGYTDYTAMSFLVNDDLMVRPPMEQFALLGFANGFLHGLENRLAEETEASHKAFCLSDPSTWDRQVIGWLSYLQKAGTDNADPSTENLTRVIKFIAETTCKTGPITMDFWHKKKSGKTESADGSGTSPDLLNALAQEYRKRFREGENTAERALPSEL